MKDIQIKVYIMHVKIQFFSNISSNLLIKKLIYKLGIVPRGKFRNTGGGNNLVSPLRKNIYYASAWKNHVIKHLASCPGAFPIRGGGELPNDPPLQIAWVRPSLK